MKQPGWVWILVVGLAAGLLTMACAGSSQSANSRNSSQSAAAPQPPAAVTGARQDAAAAGPANPAPAASPAAARPAAITGGAPGEAPPDPQTTGNFDTRLIIYNAQLRLTVADVSQTVQELTRIASQSCSGTTCGFVSESSLRYENDRQLGTVSIQVPSDKYGEALNQVRGLGQKILSETSKSQDVTEEFTDLQSELRALQATEERYLQLLVQAKTVQDIVLLEDRLRTVRTQIEKIQGRVNFLQHRADLATITVDLAPPATGLTSAALPQPVAAAQRAWDASLLFLSNLLTVVVTVVVFFWWLIPFAAILLIAIRVWWGRRQPRAPTAAAVP